MAERIVLIIEDETDLCIILQEYFLKKQFTVYLAHTVADGRTLAALHKPEIVILDNNLPDGTGWDLAAQMAMQHQETYFILMSAFHPDVPQLPAGTRYQVVEKPITMSELNLRFGPL